MADQAHLEKTEGMKFPRVIIAITVGVLLLGAGSCGGTSKHVRSVSAEEVNLGLHRQTIALGVIKCIHAEQQSGDAGTVIGGRSEKEDSEVSRAVRELIAAFRKTPDAIWPSDENPKRSARTYLAEEAESLQKFCWPWLAREIRTVLTYG